MHNNARISPTMIVDGDPTSEEEAAITATLWYAVSGVHRQSQEADALYSGADARLNPDEQQPSCDSSAGDSSSRLRYSRRCPVCNEQYDSRLPLETGQQISTTAEGSSTICLYPSGDAVFVHQPELR